MQQAADLHNWTERNGLGALLNVKLCIIHENGDKW